MKPLIQFTCDILDRWATGVAHGRVPVSVADTPPPGPAVPGQLAHLFPELFLILQGENHFTSGARHWVVRKGEALLIPAGVPHAEEAHHGKNPFQMLVIGLQSWQVSFIYGRRGQDPAPFVEAVFCTPNPQAKAQQMLLSAIERYFQDPAGHPTGLRLVEVLLAELSRHLQLPVTYDWTLAGQTLPQKALELVQARFRDADCTVATLARELGVTPNYLSARFRRETGMRLSVKIRQERLEAACDLLQGTDLRIVEVAAACGFTDASPFIAHFKAQTGRTPTQYRTEKSCTPNATL